MKKINLRIMLTFAVLLFCTACGKSAEERIAEQLELGNRYLEEMDYEQAIVAFNKVIELEPKEIRAYTGLIRTYVGEEQLEEAEKIKERGLELLIDQRENLEKKEVGDFAEALDMYFLLQGDKEASYAFWMQMIGEYPDEQEYKERLVYIGKELAEQYIENGDKDTAIDYLERVYELEQSEEISLLIDSIQNGAMNEKPVIRVTLWTPAGGIEAIYDNIYDESGYWIRSNGSYESGSMKWYIEFSYDANGNHIKTEHFLCQNSEEKLTSYTENTFDEKGNCIREAGYSPEGELEGYKENFYNELNQLIKTNSYSYSMSAYYDTSIPFLVTDYTYNDNGDCISENVAYQDGTSAVTKHIYDEKGRCIREDYVRNGELYRYDDYIYNENGKCVRVESYSGDGSLACYEEYEYDESSKFIPLNSHYNFTSYYVIM